MGPFPPSQPLPDAFLPLLGHHQAPQPHQWLFLTTKGRSVGRAFPSEGVQVPPRAAGLLKGAQTMGTLRGLPCMLWVLLRGQEKFLPPHVSGASSSALALHQPHSSQSSLPAREPLGSSGLFSGSLSSCLHPPTPTTIHHLLSPDPRQDHPVLGGHHPGELHQQLRRQGGHPRAGAAGQVLQAACARGAPQGGDEDGREGRGLSTTGPPERWDGVVCVCARVCEDLAENADKVQVCWL